MLVKYVSIDGIPQAFVFFRFVDIIDITVHDRFWNVGQANCILKYFENGRFYRENTCKCSNGRLFGISTVALITNIPLTSWGNEMKFTEKIEKELI